jgi:5-methylcytosine-specific restriction protein A
MALARLPKPIREDKGRAVIWPLEDGEFIVSEMDFEILTADGQTAIVEPVEARILHAETRPINLRERFAHIAADFAELPRVAAENPELASAISDTQRLINEGVNRSELRRAANTIIRLQRHDYGDTNGAAISTILDLPETDLETDLKGREGRWLTRMHSYRERDRRLVVLAKRRFYNLHRRLFCEVCHFSYGDFYGVRGRFVIEAHHRTPVEELLPDSITTAADLAMVCGNCHGIIHHKRPWIGVAALRAELVAAGTIPP